MRVKYLFINMKYPLYVKLQGLLIVTLFAAAAACFVFLRDSATPVVKYAWALCLLVGLLEIVEMAVAIAKAKKAFHRESSSGASAPPLLNDASRDV